MEIEIVELLELITEEQIKKLGYKNFSYMKEASLHSTWRPRLIIINENDEEIIINSEKEIIKKLKEIINE